MTSTDHPADDRIATWHVIVGTARGSAHHANGLPNQDAVARQEGPGAVTVAIADGHGHARHFRSADGSALAVDVACRLATRTSARLTADGKQAGVTSAAQGLVRNIVADWRSAVAHHLAARPFTAEQQSALDLGGDGPEVPYGSTLLVAMIAGPWLVCTQIGDGDMLGVCPDGGLIYPVAADDRLDGHRTTSLCQPDAVASFRTGAYDLREVPIAALLLATDGYGNAQAEDPWQPGVCRDLAALAASRDRQWFEQQVPDWAERCASSDGSGDDTTIALLLPPGFGADQVHADQLHADADGEVLTWTD